MGEKNFGQVRDAYKTPGVFRVFSKRFRYTDPLPFELYTPAVGDIIYDSWATVLEGFEGDDELTDGNLLSAALGSADGELITGSNSFPGYAGPGLDAGTPGTNYLANIYGYTYPSMGTSYYNKPAYVAVAVPLCVVFVASYNNGGPVTGNLTAGDAIINLVVVSPVDLDA